MRAKLATWILIGARPVGRIGGKARVRAGRDAATKLKAAGINPTECVIRVCAAGFFQAAAMSEIL